MYVYVGIEFYIRLIYIYICVYIHVHIYTYTFALSHIHIHIYICICLCIHPRAALAIQLDTSPDIADRPEKRMVKELSRYEDLGPASLCARSPESTRV